jgi:hypothetical protein
MLLELTNELSFITQGEPTRDHYFEQFVYWSVSSVATGICLPNRCPAMDYSASTHCHANACQFRSDQSVVSDTRPANRVSEPLRSNGRLFWLHYSGFQPSCHNIQEDSNLQSQQYRYVKDDENCCLLSPFFQLVIQPSIHAVFVFICPFGWNWDPSWNALDTGMQSSECRGSEHLTFPYTFTVPLLFFASITVYVIHVEASLVA